jgi:type III restriction enzyme
MLVIEYKGAYLSTTDDTKEKRLIGDLWSDRSNGACVFVMVENREFGKIDAAMLTFSLNSFKAARDGSL